MFAAEIIRITIWCSMGVYFESAHARAALLTQALAGLRFVTLSDLTHEPLAVRSHKYGIYSRAGIFYVRNTRFENSTQCDMNTGIFWMFNNAHRVSSVGSRMFVCEDEWDTNGFLNTAGPLLPFPPDYNSTVFTKPPGTNSTSWWGPKSGAMTLRDCHVASWTGAVAVNVTGHLQVHDCSFTDPVQPHAVAVQHRSGPTAGFWPILLSNNTVSAGKALRDPTDTDPRNLSYSLPPGHCPATGISSRTHFLKQEWLVPQRVIEFDGCLPAGVVDLKHATPEQTTAAVQSCVDAAAAAGNGAIAYFPKGSYTLSGPINVSGKPEKFFYVGGSSFQTIFQTTTPFAAQGRSQAMFVVSPGTNMGFEFMQLMPNNVSSEIARIRVLGGGSTNVSMNGVQLQGCASRLPGCCCRALRFRSPDLSSIGCVVLYFCCCHCCRCCRRHCRCCYCSGCSRCICQIESKGTSVRGRRALLSSTLSRAISWTSFTQVGGMALACAANHFAHGSLLVSRACKAAQ